MSRRSWVATAAVAALVLAGAGLVVVPRLGSSCGESVTSLGAARSTSPFLDARGRALRPDRDRDALVRTLASDPAPVGAVVGAVGYHYEQWAQVSAFDQGIGVRTRDNPDFTMLDDRSLDPLWSVQVDTRRSAYDASAKRYVVATMPSAAAPTLVALDADDGHRRWCRELGGGRVRADDPFATQILDDESVVVLSPGAGKRLRLTRLSGSDGSQQWQRRVGADEGDFLGYLDDDLLLAGGRAQFRLQDESLADRSAGSSVTAVHVGTGRTAWSRSAPAGTGQHVVGTDPASGVAVLLEQRAGAPSGRLLALDADGAGLWSATPSPGTAFDTTLRSGRVLVRAGSRWAAYSARTGRRLWQRTVPARPQFLPYGFELDSVPLLDADHVLLATTTALRTLDLRTGAMTSAALPTDGINTTYWPYQVAVSPGSIAVATNTGAVVVRRE